MTLGRAERQGRLGNVAVARSEAELPERSIYRLLHRERDRLFGDELFADLYVHHGRRSVPPSILAVVMVLQRLEGCSDREAVDRFCYDLRWRYAAGVDDEVGSFVHTVLVELRARLRASSDPDRIFRVTTELARSAGLVGVRRVLDSAPLHDAVATQDTVTLLRGAIRGLLRACPAELAGLVRATLVRDDDYTSAGNPVCDWEDAAAREQLVDAVTGGGDLTMDPGIYVVTEGLTLSAGAVLGDGVTIYLACDGYPTPCSGAGAGFSQTGSGQYLATPPITGPYQGLALFADRANTAPLSFTGSATSTFTGTIYARQAAMRLTSGGVALALDSLIVVRTLEVSSSAEVVLSFIPANNAVTSSWGAILTK